jgi:hypothetical protein
MSKKTQSRILQSEPVRCAFCDSDKTELISLFGQFLLASQYYCHNCHTVFEAVRWKEELDFEESTAKEENNGIPNPRL